MKGLWALHRRYGSLPWRLLIQPSIDLCYKGHIVSGYLATALELLKSQIKAEPSLAEIYVDPNTNKVFKEGDRIRRPQLGKTLELIAREGENTLHKKGTVAQMLVKEMKKLGGIITMEDLTDYQIRWEKPVSTRFANNTIHTVPLPASGAVLALILNVLNGFLPSSRNLTYYQRIVETFKFAYAKRTELADWYYYPDVLKVM